MKELTLQLSDALYEVLWQRAKRDNKTVAEIAIECLAAHAPPSQPSVSEADSQAAWARLVRHAGAVDLGYPTGADNESIDTDLVREYGNPHQQADG